jgi:hypothetical protein
MFRRQEVELGDLIRPCLPDCVSVALFARFQALTQSPTNFSITKMPQIPFST